jgi:hypothetical protein
MHRPDAGDERDGLEMRVAPDALFAALARALVGPSPREPAEPDGPAGA